MTYDRAVLTLLLVWPLLAAAALWLAPERRAKHLALGASVIEFALSVPLWWRFVPAAGMQFEISVPWVKAWGIGYHVGVDGISLFMVLLTTFLVPLSVLGSYNYITKRERAFYANLLVLTTGMVGVFVALDLFLFYVMWEVMLIPMYFIIGIWGGERRLYAAIKFFIYTMTGSLLMLVAILGLYFAAAARTGVHSFDYGFLLANVGPLGKAAWWFFAAFFLAFAIKVPMFPFHTWLPDAHVEAPTGGSVILAGVLLKMGTYGLLRFAMPLFPSAVVVATPLMVTLAVVGIVYGALVAVVQPDVKKLVAYSSVSHLGFCVLGLFGLTTTAVSGSVYQMLNHGLSTGGLFLLVGMIYERRHTRQIAAFGGLWKVVPLYSVALLIIMLASAGLPGLNGFIGEFLILVGSFPTQQWATAVATSGVVLGALYLLWMYQRVIFGPVVHEENKTLTDLSTRELVVIGPVIAMCFVMGLYPAPFLSRIEPSVDHILQRYVLRQGAASQLVRAEAGRAEQ